MGGLSAGEFAAKVRPPRVPNMWRLKLYSARRNAGATLQRVAMAVIARGCGSTRRCIPADDSGGGAVCGEWLPNQNGAPLRLVVPWKYGFKSIKSIVRIQLTEKQPETSWNLSAPSEYGFYSNVNPAVDPPRWSQARERRIGEFLKRDTLPFNGYAEQVAGCIAAWICGKNF